jgi:hypothetical protein
MRRSPALILAALGATLAGCVSDGPQPKEPVTPGPQPRNAMPAYLVVNVKDFVDTDQNGYLDSGSATVYAFAEEYALPLDMEGSFVFTLTGPGGAPVAEWIMGPEQTEACRIKTQVGPGYGFTLDLRRVGAEKSEVKDTALFAEFTDTKGRAVRSSQLNVTVGRAR